MKKYLDPAEGDLVTVTRQFATGEDMLPAVFLQDALNELYAMQAEPVGVSAGLCVAPESEESVIASLMIQLKEAAGAENIPLTNASVTTLPEAAAPIIQISAYGKRQQGQIAIKKTEDVLLAKWIAPAGTALLTITHKEKLLQRFAAPFLKKAEAYLQQLSVKEAAKIAFENGAKYAYSLGEGGVFAGLWDLAADLSSGLHVDLKAIPIRQETVEICECFRVNPYQLLSTGALLIVTEEGEELQKILEQEGIRSALIGKLQDSNDKIIENNGEIRYLDLPQQDEWYRLIQEGDKDEREDTDFY